MNLVFTRRALTDLAEIQKFIARDNRRAAAAELDRIDRVVLQLASGELNGPEITFRGGQRAQRWSVPPYRIYYRRTMTRTTILRVYHQARRPIER